MEGSAELVNPFRKFPANEELFIGGGLIIWSFAFCYYLSGFPDVIKNLTIVGKVLGTLVSA